MAAGVAGGGGGLGGRARDGCQGLDLRGVGTLLADALHFVLAVGPAGLSTGVQEPGEGIAFQAFARTRVPAGVDASRRSSVS